MSSNPPTGTVPVYARPGGPLHLPCGNAGFGTRLPYRREAGAGPPPPAEPCYRPGAGWSVEFLRRPESPGFLPEERVVLGDFLLSMAVVQALADADAAAGQAPGTLTYQGPYARLMERCTIPFTRTGRRTGTVIAATGRDPVRLEVRPMAPPRWTAADHRPDRRGMTMPAWLEEPEAALVRAHADLPMRYYLQMEQDLGVRLPGTAAVGPRYRTAVPAAEPGHVAFVTTTSKPGYKDYGIHRFLRVARELAGTTAAETRFTLLTNDPQISAGAVPPDLPLRVLRGIDAADCVDVFGRCELVIGNDTGLTHLAALTVRPDGTGPQVIGLYNVFSPWKWVTGSARHHTIATPFAQLAAVTDLDITTTPYTDLVRSDLWGASTDLAGISPRLVAGFAAARLGHATEATAS